MHKRLAQQIRSEMNSLVDHYDLRLRVIPGYAGLSDQERHGLERRVLELMSECLEANNDQSLIDYIRERAEQVLAAGFKPEWFQQAVAVPKEIVTPLVTTVEEGNFVWQALNRAQEITWRIVAEERRQTELNLRESEARVQHSLQEAQLRLEISRALANAQTSEEVLDVMMQHSGVYLQAHVSIFTLEHQRDGVVITLRRDDPFDSGIANALPIGTQLTASQFPLIRQASVDRAFITHDFLADERVDATTREMGRRTGSASLVAFPLSVGNDWLGMLVASCKTTAFFDEAKQQLYHTLAEQGAVALLTARLRDQIHESLARRGSQVQVSTQVAQEVAAATDLAELFHRVVTLIKERFNYYHAQIFRYEADQDVMVLVTGYGEVGQKMLAAGHKLTLGRGVVGTAAATGRPILAADVSQDKDWRPNPDLPGTRGELAVPIKLRDQVLGILDVQSDQAGALTAEDQQLLEGLCGQIAVAIESRRTEDALREREEDLNAMLEYSPEAIGVVNTQTGLFENVNRAAEQLYGLKRDELIKVGPAQLSPEFQPDGRPSLDAALEKIGMALKGETPVFEWVHVNAAGQPIQCEVRLAGLTGVRSHLVRFSVTDISERKRAEETLAAERNLIRELIDTLPDLIYAKDRESRFMLANMATARRMGAASPAELIGKSDLDFYPIDLARRYVASEQPIIREGQSLIDIEDRAVNALGEPRWHLSTKVPLRNRQGEIIGLIGNTRDITARKQAEEVLRHSEVQLSEALKIAKLAYWEYNVEKDLFQFNDQFYSVFHTTAEQEGGYQLSSAQYARKFVHPDDLSVVGLEIEKALTSTEQHYSRWLEHRILYADGGVGYISVNINVERDDQGRILRYYGANQDITERRHIEAALAQEQSLMRALMDSVTDQIYFKDLQSRFLRISKSQANRFGLSDPAQAAGKTDFDFFTEEHARPAYEDEQEIIRTGQAISKEERETWADRPDTWVLTTKFPLRNEADNIIGTFGLSFNITERKQAEAERERLLAEQQRRSLQLQTASEVSRAASSILRLDDLLPQAVELIRARFEFYYVGVFLTDDAQQWAVLRAGTGKAGQQMLANGHKLKIGGNSMISQCVTTRQAQIALDVGGEAVRFDNPLLPLTRSEMALPLVSRGRILGAVTIQSDQPAAFSADDITVLQSMADQISNAVENARLYEQAQAALQEVDAINRRLTGEAWDTYLRQQAGRDVIWATDGEAAAPEALPEMDEQLTAGEITIEPDPENDSEATVTAPILLRGQAIGAVRLRTPLADWGDDTETLLADITSHIAQAVENARLIEQTQRTAQRERTINEINARVRQSVDLDAILRTAVNELGQSLNAARVVARVGTPTAAAGDGRGKMNA